MNREQWSDRSGRAERDREDLTCWESRGDGLVHVGNDSLGRWMRQHIMPKDYGRALQSFKLGKHQFTPWKKQLRFLLDYFGRQASDGVRKIGNRTYANRSDVLFRLIDMLDTGDGNPADKMRIVTLLNFGTRHVAKLASMWEERGLLPKTRANYLSELRVLARWLGKPELIPEIPQLGRIGLNPEHFLFKTYATSDRSVEARLAAVIPLLAQSSEQEGSMPRDISNDGREPASLEDASSKPTHPHEGHSEHLAAQGATPRWPDVPPEIELELERAYALCGAECFRLELILRHCHSFGMRFTEALSFEPHDCILDSEVKVSKGTKGGRPRTLPIENDNQRKLLVRARALIKPGDSLSGKHRSLKQAENNCRYLLRKVGITKVGEFGFTPHALRHSYAHGKYESIAGVPVPVKDPLAIGDPDKMKRAQKEVAEAMGHSRDYICTAYSGSRKLAKRRQIEEKILRFKREEEARLAASTNTKPLG